MGYSGQQVGKKDSPTFAGLTLTGFSGIAKFVAGVFTGGSTTSDLPEGTNLYYTDVRADARISLQKGAVNGLATLDAGGKVPTAQLPASVLGGLKYMGTYDASGGTFPASPAQGNYWVISVQGTLGGHLYRVGDWLTYDGSAWDYIDNSTLVSSVAGRTGAIVLAQADISGLTTASSPTFAGATLSGLSVAGFIKNSAAGVLSTTPSVNAASELSGVAPIANGGTNSGTALSNNRIMVSNTGKIVEAAALTNGQLLIGSTGAAPVAASIAQGASQGVTITPSAGGLTLDTVQDIRTSATPQFAGLKLTGGTFRSIASISTATSLSATNDVVFCNGTFTATLPTPVGAAGLSITVKNQGTGTITVATAAGLIDGASTVGLNDQYEGYEFVSDGANWNMM